MSRTRKSGVQRPLAEPDPIYNSRSVTVLVNRVLKSGKKSLAQKIVYKALLLIAEKTEQNPVFLLEKAVQNVTPKVSVKSRKTRGSIRHLPVKVRFYRGTNLSMKWITEFSRHRPGKSMAQKLSNEILDAAKGTGKSIRKKQEIYKLADKNKMYASYRFRRQMKQQTKQRMNKPKKKILLQK